MVICIDQDNRLVHVGSAERLLVHFEDADAPGSPPATSQQLLDETATAPPVNYEFYLLDGRALTATANPPGFKVAATGSTTPRQLNQRVRASMTAVRKRLDQLE